jgi:hypothetical protein
MQACLPVEVNTRSRLSLFYLRPHFRYFAKVDYATQSLIPKYLPPTQRSQRNQRSQPSQRIKPIKRSQRIKRSDTVVLHSLL